MGKLFTMFLWNSRSDIRSGGLTNCCGFVNNFASIVFTLELMRSKFLKFGDDSFDDF